MNILFLSHCTPYPPDKGERIRAYRELVCLGERHRVHVVCFAKTREEAREALAVEKLCASVHIEPMRGGVDLAAALARFAAGESVTLAYYRSGRLAERVKTLAASERLDVTFAYSSAMGQYAPANVPLVADLVDVDSEKWRQYAATRWPGFVYQAECRRLRRREIELGRRAARTILCTEPELSLYRSFAPEARAVCIENGVDVDTFNPQAAPHLPALEGKRFAVFVGAMDYYPNCDAAGWFARDILPAVREQAPGMEFYIVGRNPSKAVRELAGLEGVTVTGGVPDVRPYLRAAEVFVAPLRIARGIQNKVLEALAMGKRVAATEAVGRTFGSAPPVGLAVCETVEAFVRTVVEAGGPEAEEIRSYARRRFSWPENMARLLAEVEQAGAPVAR